MDKLISVIIPVYNAENYIEQTVRTVLNQTYDNFELLLVDDDSTDGSLALLEKLAKQDKRIKIVDNDNSGSAARTRNAGIRAAKGELLAYLDADDLWDKDKLLKTKEFLESMNSAFVFTSYEYADVNGIGTGKIVKVPKSINYNQALSRTIIFTSTVMFDLTKLTKEEIMMPDVKSEDTACWWKILKTGITANGLNESLVKYRRSSSSLSANKIEAVRRIWNLYRKVEKLSLIKSVVLFVAWAFGAVVRRI